HVSQDEVVPVLYVRLRRGRPAALCPPVLKEQPHEGQTLRIVRFQDIPAVAADPPTLRQHERPGGKWKGDRGRRRASVRPAGAICACRTGSARKAAVALLAPGRVEHRVVTCRSRRREVLRLGLLRPNGTVESQARGRGNLHDDLQLAHVRAMTPFGLHYRESRCGLTPGTR